MALKATIFKASVNIADMNRHYYGDHELTIARHPSENDERMMIRLMAWLLHASDSLTFTRGISSDDEPDIWSKNLSGDIEIWIDLGQPDEKRLRKACGRAKRVVLYNYGGRSADSWWQQNDTMVNRFRNLEVYNIPASASELVTLSRKSMKLQCSIQDQHLWLNDDQNSIQIDLEQRFPN